MASLTCHHDDSDSNPPLIDPTWPPFYSTLHQQYIVQLSQNTETYEYQMTEHLRLSGIYWGLTAMSLLKSEDQMNPDKIVEWVMQGYQSLGDGSMGGWGGNHGHDVHLLYTTSAVQILALTDNLSLLDTKTTSESNSK